MLTASIKETIRVEGYQSLAIWLVRLQQIAYGDIKDLLKLCRGRDCLEKFCDYIRQEAIRLHNMFPEKLMDPLTPKQWKKHN